jgi:hypothetical protein
MSEYTELILDASYKFNISIQYSLITLSKLQVVHSKVRLKDIFHINCSLRRVTSTEGIQCIHHSHIQVYCFRLEQSTCWLALIQHLIDDLVPEIKSLHRKLLPIDLLVRVSHVEGTTEEHVVIGGILSIAQYFIIEQIISHFICCFTGLVSEGLAEER